MDGNASKFIQENLCEKSRVKDSAMYITFKNVHNTTLTLCIKLRKLVIGIIFSFIVYLKFYSI